jgi:hypothetical protein
LNRISSSIRRSVPQRHRDARSTERQPLIGPYRGNGEETEAGKELGGNEETNEQKEGIERNNSNHNNRNSLPLISLEVSRARLFKRIGNISEYSIQLTYKQYKFQMAIMYRKV